MSKKIRRSFLRNTTTLVSGNIIAQAITISLMPIITRIYPPSHFGIFSIFVSISVLSTAFSHLRYVFAIPLPVDEKDAHALILVSIFTVILTSLIFLGFLLIFGPKLFTALNVGIYSFCFYLLPLVTFLTGMGWVFYFANLRGKRFRNLALSKISGAACDRATMLAMGLWGVITPLGLIIGRLFGNLATLVTLIFSKHEYYLFGAFSKESFKRFKKVALRYKDFPIYSWSGLLQQLSTQLPVIILASFFSPLVAGYYALTHRVLAEPIRIVGEALSRSFYQKASEITGDREKLYQLTERLLQYMVKLIFPPMVLLAFSGGELFCFVFGEKWQQAGLYTALLTPAFITIFISKPTNVIFDVLEKQRAASFLNALLLILNVASLLIGGNYGSSILAVGLLSLTWGLGNILKFYWILMEIEFAFLVISKLIGMGILRAAIFSIPIISMKFFFQSSEAMVLLISLLTVVIFFLYIIYSDKYIRGQFGYLATLIFPQLINDKSNIA